MTGKADEAALCGCMAQMTPHPLGQTPCVFTAYQGSQPAPVSDDRETLREAIIRILRIWDTESVEPAEDCADALLSGPLAGVLAENERLDRVLGGLSIEAGTLRAERDALRAENERLNGLLANSVNEWLDDNDRINDLEDEVDALRAENERLREELRDERGSHDVTQEQRDQARGENERLRAALAIALSHLDDPRCAEVRAALNTPEGEK